MARSRRSAHRAEKEVSREQAHHIRSDSGARRVGNGLHRSPDAGAPESEHARQRVRCREDGVRLLQLRTPFRRARCPRRIPARARDASPGSARCDVAWAVPGRDQVLVHGSASPEERRQQEAPVGLRLFRYRSQVALSQEMSRPSFFCMQIINFLLSFFI
jgi:hypothetical protein